MSDEIRKPHTRFVVGGAYRRKIGANQELVGLMIGGTLHGSGLRNGAIYTASQAPVSVIENSQTLDEWVLVSEPINAELLASMEASYLHRLQALEARISALESELSGSATTEPAKADPMSELIAVGQRAKQKPNTLNGAR
jgi:hypothetical protein